MMSKSEQRELRNQKIVDEVAEGTLTYNEIAQKYGLTRARVDQIVQHAPNSDEVRTRHKELKAAPKKEILAKAIEEQLTYREIAEKFGKDQNYWRAWAKRLDMEDDIATSHDKVVARNNAIIDFLNQGHTQIEASEKFGIGQSAISGIALRSGRRRRLTGKALDERNANIRADLESGLTIAELSAKYDVSTATVYNVSRTAGLSTPRDPEAIKERNAKIEDALTDGKEPLAVAEELGVSIYVVRNVAKNLGYDVRQRFTGKDKAKRDRQIAKDYCNGWTYSRLAKKYEVSVATVYNALKTNGVIGRDVQALTREARDERIVEGYRSGKTYDELSEEFGVCTATIYKAVKNAGEIGNGNPRGRRVGS